MSEFRANTISDAAGTGPATLTGQYAAKAWGNLTGNGTAALADGANVASITDNGTGDYTFSYTNVFADANYCFTSGGSNGTRIANVGINDSNPALAGSVRVQSYPQGNTVAADGTNVYVNLTGALA